MSGQERCSLSHQEQSEPGPGVRLIQARARMRQAVLSILAVEASMVTGAFAGSPEAKQVYAEQADAARALVLAENAWEDHQAAAAARYGREPG